MTGTLKNASSWKVCHVPERYAALRIPRFLRQIVTVACDSPVYWPRFKKTYLKTNRIKAHDETMALVEGDIVHIQSVPRMQYNRAFVVDYIVKPNIEARMRMITGMV